MVQAGVWPTEIDRASRQLEASEVAERRAAAARLSSLPAKVAAPLLGKALEDADADVRLAAAAALIELRLPPPEDRLLGWFNEQDARLRLAAAQALRAGVSAGSLPALARALGDADLRVRQAAAVALGNSGQGDAVVALLGHLDDPTPEVRVSVVDALWKLGDARAVVPLAGKVQDGAPEVRRAVVRALGELGDQRATNALILSLRDPANDVRTDALTSLGLLADPSAVPALIPLTDPQQPAEVRRAALEALGRIGTARSLEVLVKALERDEPGRSPARDALVASGPRALPVLVGVLGAPASERSASFAAEALGQLGARETREPIVAALRRGVLPAAAALRALRGLADPASVQVVLELIADRSASVRAEARATLEVLLEPHQPQGQAVDPLAAALADTRFPVAERAALLRLLGRTRSPRAARIIAPLLASAPLRLAAIDALGLLGEASETSPLLVALDDDDALVRAHAAAALAQAGGEAEAAALLDRISSAQQQDRSALAAAVAGALGRVSSPALLARVGGLLASTDGALRDALLEGLGRASAAPARDPLRRATTSTDAADRRKAAEALAGHADGREALAAMLRDTDASVRATVAWSLGSVGVAADLEPLGKLLADLSPAVAANAATSFGQIAARASAGDEARKLLCVALRDGRPAVRAGALAGLQQARVRCERDGEAERQLLAADPSPLARAAVADLLLHVPASPAERDRRALARCRREDPYGSVALRCSASPRAVTATEPTTILVVPDGKSQPAPETPFALRLADRRIRHGLTDRRGAVHEAQAPAGPLSLEVAAPFVR